MDGLATCELTKEIMLTSNWMFRFVTKLYSDKYSRPITWRGSQQPHSLPHGISSHATYKKGRGNGHLVVTCNLFSHFLYPFLFSLSHIPSLCSDKVCIHARLDRGVCRWFGGLELQTFHPPSIPQSHTSSTAIQAHPLAKELTKLLTSVAWLGFPENS